MRIAQNIEEIVNKLPENVKLIAVSKFQPNEKIMDAYNVGLKNFGENYVQELVSKHETLPEDINWHFIGHLQSNKVKYIAPFVRLIHTVDSFRLLKEINKEAAKNDRIINCLFQIYIAEEETKSGMTEEEFFEMLEKEAFNALRNIKILGVMGMSTFTSNENQIVSEFRKLKKVFEHAQEITKNFNNFDLTEISMGMSGDWPLAIKEGSTMVRIGSNIFGSRN